MMKKNLRNTTRKTILAKDFRICRSPWSKAIGLMFSKEKKVKEKSLIFEFSNEGKRALHMWFVPYSIDVLFLDEKKQVVEMKERFKPWHYYSPKNKSKYVIELPAGTVKKCKTRIGDKMAW